MSKKQWRISITIDKELYEQLEERAEREARTLASLGKYLLLKGIEAENGNELTTTQEDKAA
ncbi:ribbon-helix-helix protein, CopG family [Plectonema cf. radiosum LEGE 06105]|uniref:Ribbon-helix-helix protein, CopG family n=1 Tax=Plectonema cf. radiosum LEGE 06105 TaxID=945769 RepID=A0A8J7JXR7_9CYAN|nr:ribbon-helix-helix protein, CopG family [Plectonema radiosum]MBE9217015.1 ribbon-helix-helix protein, CopG family [Plectonema cf. radiosum LEGE 06105]